MKIDTSTSYDFWTGGVSSTIDANNQTTSVEYNDALDRITAVIRPAGGGRTDFEYSDSVGSLFVRTLTDLDATRRLDSYQYFDGLGRSWRNRLSEGATSIYTDTQYDSMGRVWRVSNPYRDGETIVWTTTGYDALSRVVSVTTPDNAVVKSSYSGNRVLVADQNTSDQLRRKRISVSDALGRLKEVWEVTAADSATESISFPNWPDVTAGYRTKYEYDVLDNLTSVTQRIGTTGTTQTRTFVYDSLKRLTSATNPESGTMTYGYDNNGNLTSKLDARGVSTTYIYDALNRNINVNYSDATPDLNRKYDMATNGKGRLNQVWQNGTTTSATYIDQYDGLGRPLLQRQRFQTGGVWSGDYTVERTYDLAGHVKTQTYPSVRTVTYNYDLAGRLGDKDVNNLAFTGDLGDGSNRTYSSAIAYWAFGGLRQEKFSTDTAIYNKMFYNSRFQLSEIRESTQPDNTNWNRGAIINHYSDQCWGQCGGPNSGQSMTDNNGNLKRQEVYIPDTAQGEWPAVIYTTWFNYDALNRLQYANGERWASGPNILSDYWKQTFLPYDRYGNRRIDTNTNNTYPAYINNKDFTVDPLNNRLGVPGGQSGVMNYDAVGNLINDTYSSQTSGGTGQRNYDAENRMTGAQDAYGNWSYYTYNADGQRVRRRVNGKDTWQIYGMDGELVAEYDANAATNSAPLKEYGYRNGQLLVTADQVNLALGKPATQSSTHHPTTPASKAVDGNTNGALWDGYASATNASTNSWWEVDLGSVESIGPIQVWGRTDGWFDHTSNYYVFVSDNPFTSYDLNTTLNQPGVSNYYVPGYSGTPGTINANRTGRYVRVQLAGTNYLVLGEVKVLRNTANVNWLVTDQLGTPRMVFDKTGSLANMKRHDYLPFGEEISAFGGRTPAQGYVADGIRQQFTAYERDIETGLDYARARYYANAQGRFTSVDPLMASARPLQPQNWNRYAYCVNNPLKYVDPTGLEWVWKHNKDRDRYEHKWVTGEDLEQARSEGWQDVVYDENGRYRYEAIDENGQSLGRMWELRPDGRSGWADEFFQEDIRNLCVSCAALQVFTDWETFQFVLSITPIFGSVSTGPLRGGLGPVSKGVLGVDRAVEQLKLEGATQITREVTFETGVLRTRPDLTYVTADGIFMIGEAKNGPFARLSTNQNNAFNLIRTQGGIPRGENAAAAGLTPGVPIGPTPVRVFHFKF